MVEKNVARQRDQRSTTISAIYSFCEKFSKKLQKETDEIFHDSMEIDREFIKKDKDSKIKLKHRFWAKILEKFL